jgi:hypothetical protein
MQTLTDEDIRNINSALDAAFRLKEENDHLKEENSLLKEERDSIRDELRKRTLILPGFKS